MKYFIYGMMAVFLAAVFTDVYSASEVGHTTPKQLALATTVLSSDPSEIAKHCNDLVDSGEIDVTAETCVKNLYANSAMYLAQDYYWQGYSDGYESNSPHKAREFNF